MPSSAAVNNDGKSDRLFSIPGQDQLANLGFMDENQLKDAIQHPGSAIGPTTNRGRPFSLSGVQRVPDTPVQQQGTRNDHTNDGSSGNASGIGNDHVSSPLPPPTSESRLPIKPDDSDWATVETDTGDDSSGAGQSYQRHELPPGADTPKLYSHSPGQQSAKSAQEGTSTTISKNDPLPRPRTPSYDFGPHIMTNPLPPPNPKYLQSIYRPSDPEPEPTKAHRRPEGDNPRDGFNENAEMKEKELKQARSNALQRFEETAQLKRDHAHETIRLEKEKKQYYDEVQRYQKIEAQTSRFGRGELHKPMRVADVIHQWEADHVRHRYRRGGVPKSTVGPPPFKNFLQKKPLYNNVRDRMRESTVNAWLLRAKVAEIREDWQAMESHSEQARDLANALGWAPFEAKCKVFKAIALFMQKEYVSAYEHFAQADNVIDGYYISPKEMGRWLERSGKKIPKSSIPSAKPAKEGVSFDSTTGPGTSLNVDSPPEDNEKSTSGSSAQSFHSVEENKSRQTVRRENIAVCIEIPQPQPRQNRRQHPLYYGNKLGAPSPSLAAASPPPTGNLKIVQPHVAPSSLNQETYSDVPTSAISDLALDEPQVQDGRSLEPAESHDEIRRRRISAIHEKAARLRDLERERSTEVDEVAHSLMGKSTEMDEETDKRIDDVNSNSEYHSARAGRVDYERHARASPSPRITSKTKPEHDAGSPPSPGTLAKEEKEIAEIGKRIKESYRRAEARKQKTRVMYSPIVRSARTAMTAAAARAPWQTPVGDQPPGKTLPFQSRRTMSAAVPGAVGREPVPSPLRQRAEQPRVSGEQWRRTTVRIDEPIERANRQVRERQRERERVDEERLDFDEEHGEEHDEDSDEDGDGDGDEE